MPHYRCSHCSTRRTLKQPVEQYLRVPRCRVCGHRKYRRDKYRDTVEMKRKPCTCWNYPFPHARGRGMCQHNANLTPEKYKQLYEGLRRE